MFQSRFGGPIKSKMIWAALPKLHYPYNIAIARYWNWNLIPACWPILWFWFKTYEDVWTPLPGVADFTNAEGMCTWRKPRLGRETALDVVDPLVRFAVVDIICGENSVAGLDPRAELCGSLALSPCTVIFGIHLRKSWSHVRWKSLQFHASIRWDKIDLAR